MKYGKNLEAGKRKPPLDVTLRTLYDYAEHQNVADELDEDVLKELGARVFDDYEIDKESRRKEEESNQQRALINQANKVGQITHNFSVNKEDTFSIIQRHVGYTNANSKYPILATFAGSCVICAMYNKASKVASMAHLDTLTDVHPSLNRILVKMSEGKNEDIEVHLAGGNGYGSSINLMNIIIKSINSMDITIKSSNLNSLKFTQLAIDSRTGQITDEFSPMNVTESEDHNIIVQIVGMKISKSPLFEQTVG